MRRLVNDLTFRGIAFNFEVLVGWLPFPKLIALTDYTSHGFDPFYFSDVTCYLHVLIALQTGRVMWEMLLKVK